MIQRNIGAGKTTLARRFLEELDENLFEATLLVVIHSSVSSDWLLKKRAMLLGIEDVKEDKLSVLSQIHRQLMEINENGRRAVILIDEVQMLNSKEIMEEFRGLLNLEVADGKLVNFIFFGLPDIEQVLALDEPLKQRVALKVNLKSFSEENTREYIQHRLRIASCDREIFTRQAIRDIFAFSRGIPRLINTICDNMPAAGRWAWRPVGSESSPDAGADSPARGGGQSMSHGRPPRPGAQGPGADQAGAT